MFTNITLLLFQNLCYKKSHIKNHVFQFLFLYCLVWNVDMCSICSCRIEPLTSMRECKINCLSWHCLLTSRRFCASIHIFICSNRLTWLWAIMREQPNIFAATFLGSFWRTSSISTVDFSDVICWFLMFWLKSLPNSTFTYSKYRHDNLPDLKMQFDVFFSANQVWFFLYVGCLVRHMTFISAYF